MQRLAALALALSLAACATQGPFADLQGRWKATDSKALLSDGTTITQAPPCWLEFAGERVVTECHFGTTVSRLVRVNRATAPGQMESEVIESTGAPPVGVRTRIEYRIAEGKLYTVSHPQPPKQARTRYPVRVEATWIRE